MGKKKDAGPSSAENIKVVVRCRPLNGKERDAGYKSCVDLNLVEGSVQVNHVCGAPDKWTFDGVVNNTFEQKDVFVQFIQPLTESVMDGFNATVFAYGQSGSGKTHTMTGKLDDEDLMGIIPRTFRYVFDRIKAMQQSNPSRVYNLSCSFVELYNGKVRDLLTKQQVTLAVKENKDKSFFVQGVHIPAVKFPEELIRHMDEGTDRRQVSATELNADSSRSHSIFTLIVECVETSEDGDARSVTSKFNLVDLAGSERQTKTGATGDTMKEGCNINLSLSALGTVIDTLVKGKGHVPFRSSPLTMLLKDSLGGSSKTVMFANMGPSEHNLSETVSTLRFADRAKQIKNKPTVNMDTKDQKIQELSELVGELKEKLKLLETGGVKEMEKEIEELREKVGEQEVDLDNAVKGREADSMEFKEAKQALEAQLGTAKEAEAAAMGTAKEKESELTLSEQQVKDLQAQIDEIFRTCTAHFGEDVADVDTLHTQLKALEGAVSPEEHQATVADLKKTQAEAKAAGEHHQAVLAEATRSAAEFQEEAEQLKQKLEKAQEKIERERDVRRQMAETQDTSPMRGGESGVQDAPGSWLVEKHELKKSYELEIEELQGMIEQLEKNGGGDNTKAEATAEELRVLQEEHKAAMETLTAFNGDESGALRAAKELAKAKDAQIEHLRFQVQELENQATTLRRGKMTRRASNSGVALAHLSSQQEQSHTNLRSNLREELHKVAEHRDMLLAKLMEDPMDDAQRAEELQKAFEQLRAEATEAREQREAAQDALQAAEADAAASAAATARRGDGDDERVKHLTLQVDALVAEMNEDRKKAAQREEELLAPLLAKAEAAEGEDGNDNPLGPLVEMLRKDKTTLQEEVSELTKRLHTAMQESNAADHSALGALAGEDIQELERLREAMTAPRDDDSEETAKLREEIKLRDTRVADLSGALERAMSSSITAGPRVDGDAHSPGKAALQMEHDELKEQLEQAHADAEAEVKRRETAVQELQTALHDATEKSKEAAQLSIRIAELEGKVEEMEVARDKAAKDTESHTENLQRLEGKVKERTDQANEMRRAVDGMKERLAAGKAKTEEVQSQLTRAKEEHQLYERAVSDEREERDAYFQKLLNKRLEEASVEHQKALERKEEDVTAAKKKVKKVNDKLTKLKEDYDGKLCELGELMQLMEEHKVEGMKAWRNQRDLAYGMGSPEIEPEEERPKGGDALKRAKEEKRKKADMFATGEVKSAVSGVSQFRAPVGSGVSHVKAARARPPSGTPNGEDEPNRSPRPAGYSVGKATPVDNARGGGGGAGFNSYVPEAQRGRPPTAQGGSSMPAMGGVPGSSYGGPPRAGSRTPATAANLAMMGGGGGGGAGGDMYDF